MSLQVDQNVNLPSDHAPVSLWLNSDKLCVNTSSLQSVDRSRELGSHVQVHSGSRCSERQIRMAQIDQEQFAQIMNNTVPPVDLNDVDRVIDDLNSTLRNCAIDARKQMDPRSIAGETTSRWNGLINSDDSKAIWTSTNWSGNVS